MELRVNLNRLHIYNRACHLDDSRRSGQDCISGPSGTCDMLFGGTRYITFINEVSITLSETLDLRLDLLTQ
jgi:hypothetical protein